MAENKLKRAFEYAFMLEMDEIPAPQELETIYSFSDEFESKMAKLTEKVKKQYFTVLGFPFSKYAIGISLMFLSALAVFLLKYKNIIDRSTSRLIFTAVEFFILSVFGVSLRRVNHDMTRTARTGFTEYEEPAAAEELEFPLPVPPEDYRKTNEYRTTTTHTAEYTDVAGRKISYSRIDIRTGVLTKIDTPSSLNTTRVGQLEAVWFIKDGQTNLIWADKRYRYQLTGMCDIKTLTEMAQTI